MFFLDDKDYIPLLSVTYAVKADNSQIVKSLFDKYVDLVPSEKVKDLFNTHKYCTSMTIEEYKKYQYFFGLCLICKSTNDRDLGIQIEKLFRAIFPSIYSCVRKKHTFNIMDYYFLYKDADGLTIMSKQDFSGKAVALCCFILNRWGERVQEAFEFAMSLYSIVLTDRNTVVNAQSVRVAKTEIEDERALVKSLFEKENIEMCFDKMYGMYHINFDMLFAESGLKEQILSDSVNIKKIVWGAIQNSNQIIDFLSYNSAILMSTLEDYMMFLNGNEIHYNYYIRRITEKKVQLLETEIQKKDSQLAEEIKRYEAAICKYNEMQEKTKEKQRRLEVEIEKLRHMLKETVALRSYIYEMNADTFCEYDSNELKWDELDSVSGVIVGGTDAWQKRLKEKLPSWRFISASQNSYDKNIIVASEFVFFNTSFVGHSMYYSIVSIIQSSENVKLGFINNINLERVYREIEKQIGNNS